MSASPVPQNPRDIGRPVRGAFVFAFLVATMLATLLVAASALGMYEAILVAELVALAIVATAAVIAWRRRGDGTLSVEDRRHRERRGF